MKAISIALSIIAMLSLAHDAHAAQNCRISIKGDDAMQFDVKQLTVSSSCSAITVELTHTGNMPAETMGHNVVVTRTEHMDSVSLDGLKAGAAKHYVPGDDSRVIASTSIIGGGETTSVTFPGEKLTPGEDYTFFCSFPGHRIMMKGKLIVTD